MSPLSTVAVSGALAQETGILFLHLITISHASLPQPIRIVADTEDVVSRGNTYYALACNVVLPDASGETIPNAKLVVDNVDQTLVERARTIPSRAEAIIEIVLKESPDTVQFRSNALKIQSSSYNANQIEFELGPKYDFLNKSACHVTFSTRLFPAVNP